MASLAELPLARAVLLDTSPRQFLQLAGTRVTSRQRRAWARFKPGPGVCKVDWALDGPVPWSAGSATARRRCMWAAPSTR